MTIQEELEIYQRMLKAFRRQYWKFWIVKTNYKKRKYSGFCTYININIWRKFDWPRYCNSIEDLCILNSLKPIELYDVFPKGYWFVPYKMSPRIKLLKKAIKICKQQLKSENYMENI